MSDPDTSPQLTRRPQDARKIVMMRFLALALTLALGLAEEAAEEKKVGDVIGIDLGTTYSCGTPSRPLPRTPRKKSGPPKPGGSLPGRTMC